MKTQEYRRFWLKTSKRKSDRNHVLARLARECLVQESRTAKDQRSQQTKPVCFLKVLVEHIRDKCVNLVVL